MKRKMFEINYFIYYSILIEKFERYELLDGPEMIGAKFDRKDYILIDRIRIM